MLPHKAKFSKPDLTGLWNHRNRARGQGVNLLDEGIDRYLRIKCAGGCCDDPGAPPALREDKVIVLDSTGF